MKFTAMALVAALLSGTAAQAVTLVTVEAAGLTSTTRNLAVSAVENFDAQTTGGNVTPVNTSFNAIGVTGVFTSTQVLAADQYTGAGGTGNGVAVRETGDLSISFTGTPLNYFGVWASALDANNTVAFYKGATLLGSTNLTAFPLSGAYAGNPSGPFAGQNGGEKYAFFNFRVTEGFDRVVLSQNGGGGFELDNITIGAAVPEPATWGMMIVGFGLVGLGVRRRMPVVTA